MFEFTRKLIPTKSQFVVIMCLLRENLCLLQEVLAIIVSVLIIPFIMFLPNSEGRHFFLTLLINFSSIIQMFCFYSLFFPVDFLVMRLICLISLLLAQYYNQIIITFKMVVKTYFCPYLYSLNMEKAFFFFFNSWKWKNSKQSFLKPFCLFLLVLFCLHYSAPYNCTTKISYQYKHRKNVLI